jgi:hypothetical protein
MSPSHADDSERWTRQIQDAMADTSAVRDGLQDDEAIPFIEWGSARAAQIGDRLVAPGTPEPDGEHVSNLAYTLTRLMTRLNWVVTYRHKKDAAWLTRTFHKINDLSRDLFGPDAPTLTDDAIADWIAAHEQRTNGDLLHDLMVQFTPAVDSAETATPPEASGPAAPFGSAGLPGRAGSQDATSIDPDSLAQGADSHEQ